MSGVTLDGLMASQAGLVSRSQVLACHLDDTFIETRLRRNQWRRVHRGVYVDHTGPLSWLQRLWAVLLFHGDAVACAESALVLHGLRPGDPTDLLHVAVAVDRRVRALPGVKVHRLTALAASVQPNRRPPRLRLERAVLQVAARSRDEAAAVAVLADACQSRRTTAGRLLADLELRTRAPRRAFLLEVLGDVATGAFSVLEHRYLTRVERPHGLPSARRQSRARGPGGRSVWRDVEYLGGRLVVELDGRLGHDATEDRWADFDRDIASAVDGAVTLRLGWRQVLDPCRIARGLVRLLQGLGWEGRPTSCGVDCSLVPSAVGVRPAP